MPHKNLFKYKLKGGKQDEESQAIHEEFTKQNKKTDGVIQNLEKEKSEKLQKRLEKRLEKHNDNKSLTVPQLQAPTQPSIKTGSGIKKVAGIQLVLDDEESNSGANVTGVNLTGANGAGANATGANGAGVNLTGANGAGANATGSINNELSDKEKQIKKEGFEKGIEEGKKKASEEAAFGNNNPLNRTFNDVYKIVAWLCVVLFIAIFLLTVLDIFLYSYDYLIQRSSLKIDPNMFNKETHEYSVLNYIKTNKTSDEPYHVFLCEQLYATVYLLVGITVLMIGLEYGASVLLNFYNAYTGESKDYSVDLSSSKTFLIVIIIALVGAAVFTSIYNAYFINDTQTSMLNIQQNMTSIKNTMYKNCTTNQVFLNALTSNDLSSLINEFDNTIKDGIKTKNTVEAQRMMFTLSMYSYLTTSIPEIDPNYQTVVNIFTYNNIKNRGVDPTLYLYYNNYNINIQNLYPKLVQSVISGLEINGKVINPSSNDDPFFGPENETLKSQFVLGITQQITTITDIITKLSVNGISDGKNKLFMYMILICIAAFIFLITIIVLVYDEVPQSLTVRVGIVLGIIRENAIYIKDYIPNLIFGKKS